MVTPGGLVVLTDRRLAAGSLGSLAAVVRAAVRGGAGWVVLREKDLSRTRRRAIADELRELLPPGRLIVAGPDPLGGSAVHLASSDSVSSDGLSLVGRSCHSSGVTSDVDYVTLSPIYPSATKPGYGPALGASGAAALAGGVPWLGLGGVDSAERAAECGRAGAAGIAVLGAIMRAADPEAVARSLSVAFAEGSRGIDGRPSDLASGRGAVCRGW